MGITARNGAAPIRCGVAAPLMAQTGQSEANPFPRGMR